MTINVTAWLEQLGMGAYAQAFAENEVDADLLPSGALLRDRFIPGFPLSRRRKLRVPGQSIIEPDPRHPLFRKYLKFGHYLKSL